ncbi:TIGR02466 family protein [Brevundimonas sp. Root1279]|uniref:TIGR02466 family protein n=1 Tax=Brevundimonas sp. Root1279 TaxID=1736443 RepID=UPI0006FE4B17|nr:TIGR02466 family protein [Brevundimonas sp. Root1279]KQW83625.1 hypothetical protein ASC65_02930 [Brevundimonas sp. Root1279]
MTAKINLTMKVNHFFSTPVVVGKFQGSDALAREIGAVARDHRRAHPGVAATNVGGWHSSYDMIAWGGPPAKQLADLAIGMARQASAFGEGTPEDYVWTAQMWANISGPGASNKEHVHPGSLWAAVFYVDLGADTPGEDVGGLLHFEDPRHPLPSMRHPDFHLRDATGKPYNGAQAIKPSVGDLVLFPSWLKHGVTPYTGSGERVSIAMNLDCQAPSAAAKNRAARTVEGPESVQ